MIAPKTFARSIKTTLYAVAIGLTLSGAALAQDKPVVKVLVGFPPGTGNDNGRPACMAKHCPMRSASLPWSKTSPGAGGQIAAQALKQAATKQQPAVRPGPSSRDAATHQQATRAWNVKKDHGARGTHRRLLLPARWCRAEESPIKDLDGYVDQRQEIVDAGEEGNNGIPAPGSQPLFS